MTGNYDRDDYNVLRDEENNSFYTSQIKDSGYHHSLYANLFILLLIGGLIVALWLLSIVKDCALRWCTKKRSEPFCTNFMLRFLY